LTCISVVEEVLLKLRFKIIKASQIKPSNVQSVGTPSDNKRVRGRGVATWQTKTSGRRKLSMKSKNVIVPVISLQNDQRPHRQNKEPIAVNASVASDIHDLITKEVLAINDSGSFDPTKMKLEVVVDSPKSRLACRLLYAFFLPK
jgi:hypothetical protein